MANEIEIATMQKDISQIKKSQDKTLKIVEDLAEISNNQKLACSGYRGDFSKELIKVENKITNNEDDMQDLIKKLKKNDKIVMALIFLMFSATIGMIVDLTTKMIR